MSILFFNQSYDHDLGECGHGTWRRAVPLLPLLVDAVNEGIDTVDAPTRPPLPTTGTAFILENLLEDRTKVDEVYVLSPVDFVAFLEWCGYLEDRMAGFGLFRPLVDALRKWTKGIEDQVAAAQPSSD